MTDDSVAWTTEASLADLWPSISANWSRKESLDFDGVDGVPIHAVCVPAVDTVTRQPPILFLPGRTEPLVKYRELTFDLNRRGHTVYLIDHRGQGQSGRMLSDPERGHVIEFAHYVDDIETFLDVSLLPAETDKPVLFAHSMGGCIATRLLQRRSGDFQAAVLFSPMLEILTGLIPPWLARPLVKTLSALPLGLGGGEAYVPQGRGFDTAQFRQDGELNMLTHSEVRFNRLMQDYVEFPAARLGSPTRLWFEQAQIAMAEAIAEADQVTCPTLLFSAGDDPIVGHAGQYALCAAAPSIEGPRVIPTARHELLMEIDAIRSPVLDEAVSFVTTVTSH